MSGSGTKRLTYKSSYRVKNLHGIFKTAWPEQRSEK